MKYMTNTCPACEGSFEFLEQETNRDWRCPHCGFRALLHPTQQAPVPQLPHTLGKTYTYAEITRAVVAQVRASSDQSPATIRRIINEYFDNMARVGIKLDPRFDPRRPTAKVERWVKAEFNKPPPRSEFMRADKGHFRHWRVWSKKNNAILCAITKDWEWTNRSIPPSKELGLFWEFQSLDAEFAYLPAVWPRNEDNKPVIGLNMQWDVGPILAYYRNRKPDWSDPQRSYFPRDYSVKYHFKRDEAIAYAALLNEAQRGTEDFDNSVYVEEFTPSLWRRVMGFGGGITNRI